jgi:hypothetical protein
MIGAVFENKKQIPVIGSSGTPFRLTPRAALI